MTYLVWIVAPLCGHSAWASPLEPGQYLQLGPYESLQHALGAKSFLERLAPAHVHTQRTERTRSVFWVRLGPFDQTQQVDDFVRVYQLKRLSSGLNLEKIQITKDSPTPEPLPGVSGESYPLQVNLYCPEGNSTSRKRGEYRATLQPEMGTRTPEVEFKIRWDCGAPLSPTQSALIERPTFDPDAADRRPSFIGVGLLAGQSSLTSEQSDGSETSRAGFLYGAQITAHRSIFPALGVLAESTLLNRRLSNSETIAFKLEYRLLAGMRFSLLRRWDVDPLFGLSSSPIWVNSQYLSPWRPVLGLRTTLTLLQPVEGAGVDAYAGYGSALTQGHWIKAGIRTRYTPVERVGGEWFFEWNYRSQSHDAGLQTESYFLGGITLLVMPN